MLIKCPRCGFQQPIDKYCAQCGVDMESFKPPEVPLFKKIFGNPLIQLSLLLVIASGLGIYLYQKGQDNLQQRVTYLKSSVQINSSELNPPPPPPPEISADNHGDHAPASNAEEFASQQTESASSEVPGAKAALAATKDPSSKDNKDGRGLAKASGSHLIVYYAEVDRGALNGIFEASQNTGQFMSFKDYTAGIIPNIEKRLSASNIKILHKEDRALDSSKTLQWFYGLKDRRNPAVEIGLTTFFELNDMDSNNLRGNLEIQRTWREPNSSTGGGGFEIQRKSFPAIFEIGTGTGFFISGVMPTQSNLENDDELMAIDIYKILHSPRFRAGDSDFVIFIEFAKSN